MNEEIVVDPRGVWTPFPHLTGYSLQPNALAVIEFPVG